MTRISGFYSLLPDNFMGISIELKNEAYSVHQSDNFTSTSKRQGKDEEAPLLLAVIVHSALEEK